VAVPRASGTVFMFCTPGLFFSDIEGVRSRFLVLHFRTHFRRYRGRQDPFSCFALSNSFSAGPRATRHIFNFCAPGIVGAVPRALVPFVCCALPDSFSIVPMASSSVFTFCAIRLVWCGTDGAGCLLHVLLSRTHFRLYRGRRVPFSCFALPDSSGRYRVRRISFSWFSLSTSFSTVRRASGSVFMFCALRLIFDGTDDVMSRFHVLCSWTRLGLYRGRQVSFSLFALPESFYMLTRASAPVFIFCALGLVFDRIEGVGSCLHLLRSRTRFGWYRGRLILFPCFAFPNSF
jgi:hypothetical protein